MAVSQVPTSGNPRRFDDAAVVATLFEGDLHFGVGALVNSLHAAGFRGHVFVGYRGKLPPWADGRKTLHPWPSCELSFVELDTAVHFTFYKARFTKSVSEMVPGARSVTFIDHDVVLLCPWAFVDYWLTCGIAVVEDVGKVGMSANHPLRSAWSDFIAEAGRAKTRDLDRYYNAGFVGVDRAHASFIDSWVEYVDLVHEVGPMGASEGHLRGDSYGSGRVISARVRAAMEIDHLMDQDGLNMALMATNVPISDIGPEGMAFRHGTRVMSHAAGAVKPWRKAPVRDLLVRGKPPSVQDRAFWTYAAGPITLYARRDLRRRRSQVRAAGALSRHLGRA